MYTDSPIDIDTANKLAKEGIAKATLVCSGEQYGHFRGGYEISNHNWKYYFAFVQAE